MSPRYSLPIALTAGLLLAVSLLVAACGGGGKSLTSTDYAKVPTATAPANLPDPTLSTGAPVVQPGTRQYTVKSGDSPSAIAEKFGITADELMAANGITDPASLHPGQVLTIPGGDSTPAGGDATPASGGETPTATPRGGRTPEPTAATRNTPPAGGGTYTVQSGDTASDIAARFGLTVEELAALNHTTVDALRSLSVGDTLVVPSGAPAPASTPTQAPPAPTDTPPPADTVVDTPTPTA